MSSDIARVVVFDRFGGPEVLRLEDRVLPPPAPGEVRIRHVSIGVDFVDVYFRTGQHAPPALPSGLGVEAAGVVEAVGEGVDAFVPGDRVAHAGLPLGAYATVRDMPAERLVRLPDDVSFETAAAVMLKGITVHMLLERVHRVAPGDTVLVHAAAGGVGQLMVAWAKARGARVIGTVGSPEKAAIAMAAGLDVAIPRGEDFVAAVRAATDGRGVDHAIDGIGGATLARTLAAMAPFGMVSSIGQVAGPIPPIGVEELGPLRSIALARPSVLGYLRDPAALRVSAEALFAFLRESGTTVAIGRRLPLAAAAQAHRELESGVTHGAVVLVP